MKLEGMAVAVVAAAALQAGAAAAAEPTLDYAFFKARVEPIFLKKRPEHVRCYVCHSESNNAFKLEKLPEGKRFWSEEQSRRQFESVSRLVVPGDPEKSLLLMRPLAPQAGGYPYHSGGRQFGSKNDPEWKTLAAWVNGAKLKKAFATWLLAHRVFPSGATPMPWAGVPEGTRPSITP